MQWLLLISILVIATCGIIYELIAGTLASYLLGDSVTQFSTIIGTYLCSMGVGSYLAKYIKKNLTGAFVTIEILIGVIGGCSSLLLFFSFNHIEHFRILLYFLIGLTGILVGAEIPLVMRLLQKEIEFSELISRVFSFDYIGALVASVLFPLWFVPKLGIEKTSLFFGILNILVAIFTLYKLTDYRRNKLLHFACYISLSGLILLFVFSHKINKQIEQEQYGERIILTSQSPYQKITITESHGHLRLFLNGNLQFSTMDEYRYHESLVHPVCQYSRQLKHILILGGGDGMALREFLKYPEIESAILVDLDQKMTGLFTTHPVLRELNAKSFSNPKATIVNADAFQWLRQNHDSFDAICVDFPDPSNFSLGKLYTTAFYLELKRHLRSEGCAVVQCTSPFVAPKSFWCIEKTIRSAGLNTMPYHTLVPSFGDWGFVLLSKNRTLNVQRHFASPVKYYDSSAFAGMLWFPADSRQRNTETNNLQNQALVGYFEEEWQKVQ